MRVTPGAAGSAVLRRRLPCGRRDVCHIKRRLLNLLTALSLLLCVAMVVLWVRSFWVAESFTFDPWIELRTPDPPDDRPWFEGWQTYWSVGSLRGRLIINYNEYVHTPRQDAEQAAREAEANKHWAKSAKRMDDGWRRIGREPPLRAPYSRHHSRNRRPGSTGT